MGKLKRCSKCKKVDEECTQEEKQACLRRSGCEHCNSTKYHYPYGIDESRHCLHCGAEWK